MEFAVLKALRFACTVPTAKDFAGFFLAAEGAGEVVHSLTDVCQLCVWVSSKYLKRDILVPSHFTLQCRCHRRFGLSLFIHLSRIIGQFDLMRYSSKSPLFTLLS